MKKFPPERIVCLTEETVETNYLLGEEKRIVGVDYLVPLSDFFNKISEIEEFKSKPIIVWKIN